MCFYALPLNDHVNHEKENGISCSQQLRHRDFPDEPQPVKSFDGNEINTGKS